VCVCVHAVVCWIASLWDDEEQVRVREICKMLDSDCLVGYFLTVVHRLFSAKGRTQNSQTLGCHTTV